MKVYVWTKLAVVDNAQQYRIGKTKFLNKLIKWAYKNLFEFYFFNVLFCFGII